MIYMGLNLEGIALVDKDTQRTAYIISFVSFVFVCILV